jgi:hypothetical protein
VVRLEAGQKQVRRQVQRRREDWAVLILDHHEGYIDWDVYQSNQTIIAHNDNARGNAVRGPIKHGEALLAGQLRCGRDTIELHEVDAHWYTEEGAEIEIEALIPIASVDVSTFCATVYPRTTAAGC